MLIQLICSTTNHALLPAAYELLSISQLNVKLGKRENTTVYRPFIDITSWAILRLPINEIHSKAYWVMTVVCF